MRLSAAQVVSSLMLCSEHLSPVHQTQPSEGVDINTQVGTNRGVDSLSLPTVNEILSFFTSFVSSGEQAGSFKFEAFSIKLHANMLDGCALEGR